MEYKTLLDEVVVLHAAWRQVAIVGLVNNTTQCRTKSFVGSFSHRESRLW